MALPESELAEIDAFLAERKTLRGEIPPWDHSTFGNEIFAKWPILDELEIERGELRFSIKVERREFPSISVLMRKNLIYRLDFAEGNVCKPNSPDAQLYGLPPRVCGNHCHPWVANREHVRRNGFGDLPARSPLPIGVRRLPQALACLAQAINLELGTDQRAVDLPPLGHLFEGH